MAVADTTFLIDLLADDEGATSKLDELITTGEPLWTPSIALHELYYGARLHARHERETQRIQELEAALPPMPFTAKAAHLSGQHEAAMERDGNPPGRADIQIAGIALARGDPVVTRDARFTDVEGLQVDPY